MMILHGGMVGAQFLLWGELPPEGALTRRRGRSPATGPATLPYSASRKVLLETLHRFLLEDGMALPKGKRAVLWAPSAEERPLFGWEPETAATACGIAPWYVNGLVIEPGLLSYLLLLKPGKIPADIRFGPEMACWATALQLAYRVVALQQILPSMRHQEGSARWDAQWEPVFTGKERTLSEQIAQALPDVARALTADPIAPPERSAREAVRAFVALEVDDYLRFLQIQLPRDRTMYFYGYSQNIIDRWVQALVAESSRLNGNTAELSGFQAQIADWHTRLEYAPVTSFHLFLRLEEPAIPVVEASEADDGASIPAHHAANGASEVAAEATPEPDWCVRILLQAKDDPDRLLAPSSLADPPLASTLPDDVTPLALRRLLQAEVGRAAALWAPLGEALSQEIPDEIPLDVVSAFIFLTDAAPQLAMSGFAVQLPPWWVPGVKRQVAMRARVFSESNGPGMLGEAALMRFDWQAALGDVTMTREELLALAQEKAPLVRVRGRWMHINADEIQAALAFWKKQSHETATLSEVTRLALDSGATVNGLRVEHVDLQGWIGGLFDRLRTGRAALEELPPPAGLRAELRPYQVRGYSWLRFLSRYGLGACLADDMGLGKTVQTLALIQQDRAEGNQLPTLIVCPTSVIGNWLRETQRFAPELAIMIHHGGGRRKEDQFVAEAARHALVVTSYALLHRDLDHLHGVRWRGIVLDEAQNIKNHQTKQAQAAYALRADYRIALTGTPVENSVNDLWSLMEYLNPGLLGTQADFQRTFAAPIQYGNPSEPMARLRQLTGPFILRRMKTDPAIIADLPEKFETPVYCTLTKEQGSLYAAVLRDMEEQLKIAEGMQRRGIILATLMKLKQICNHPAHFLGDASRLPGRSGKLDRLDAMVEEVLAEGNRALIFTQFAEMGHLLVQHLAALTKREVIFLYGGVPQPQREAMITRFQEEANGPPLFVLSLKAGGLGLNLTRANHVFHFDRWWNPAVENQATDRAFRIGQTRTVQVHKFICIGTLEERINEMIEQKMALAEQVVGSGEGWLTELSTEQLREIFALRPEAVAV